MPTITVQVNQVTDDNLYRKNIGGYWLTGGPAVGYRSSSSNMYGGAWRFNDVKIPQGAIIDSAFVYVNSLNARIGEVVRSRLRGEASDNPPTFQDYTTETPDPYLDFQGRPRTVAVIDWDNIQPWIAGVWYQSPDITAIIQEIVNRPGWVPGNSIIIFWDDFDNRSDPIDGAIREGQCFDNDPVAAAQLEITYSDISPPPPPSHLLSVTTIPINGIEFILNNGGISTSYVTPWEETLETGTYMITMPQTVLDEEDTYRFVQWEDGSTNPTRTINLIATTLITATYELAPPISPINPILIIVTPLSIGLILTYVGSRKERVK